MTKRFSDSERHMIGWDDKKKNSYVEITHDKAASWVLSKLAADMIAGFDVYCRYVHVNLHRIVDVNQVTAHCII